MKLLARLVVMFTGLGNQSVGLLYCFRCLPGAEIRTEDDRYFCKRHTKTVAFKTQQLLIGAFYDSLADFAGATFHRSNLNSTQDAVSVFARRNAVHAFEVSDEMTLVGATDSPYDLFDAEKRSG